MRRLTIGCIVALMVGGLAVSPSRAVQSQCLAGKTKCASKKAFALLKCEWKAETPGRPADPNADGCVDKAQDKFDGGLAPEKGCFEKLEDHTPSDCVTTYDTAAVESLVDQCVAQVVSIIDPMAITQNRCGVSKKKCAAKAIKQLLKCYSKAQKPGGPPSPNSNGCLENARENLDGGAFPERGCIETLENRPGNDCILPKNNQDEIRTAVDGCVASIVNALENPGSTTTTTVISTTSSTIGSTTTSSPVSTTTSTSDPSGTICSANGLRVTFSIAYNEQTVSLSGVHLGLSYPSPLGIPGSAADTTVRQRVTNLAGAGSAINGWNDHDTNADGIDDVIELNSTRSSAQLGPGQIFRVRFDCPSGTSIAASSLGCFHSGATDASGSPISPAVEAAEVSCSFVLSPEP